MTVAEVDSLILQKAAGHASINTMGGCMKADLEQVVRGLRNGWSEIEGVAELLSNAKLLDDPMPMDSPLGRLPTTLIGSSHSKTGD